MEKRNFPMRRSAVVVVGMVTALVVGMGWQLARSPQPALAISVPQLAFPSFKNQAFGSSSTLFLRNSAMAPANVVITLYASSGAFFNTRSETIAVGGRLVLSASDFGLPAGFSGSALVSSDQQLSGTVLETKTDAADSLLAYKSPDLGDTSGLFGPASKGNSVESGLTLFNTGSSTAMAQVQFVNLNGSIAHTVSTPALQPGQIFTVATPQTPIAVGFSGYIRYTSNTPVVGLLQIVGPTGVGEYRGPLTAATSQGPPIAAVEQYMPRATKGATAASSSDLMVINQGTATANVFVNYYNANGTSAASESLTLPAGGGQLINLGNEPALAPGSTVSVVMSSDQPILLAELTRFNGTTYGNPQETGTQVDLPMVFNDATYQSRISVQNTGAVSATASIRYYNLAGTEVFSNLLLLQPGAATQFTPPANFSGSAVVSSAAALSVLVDINVLAPPTPTITATSIPTATQAAPPPTATGTTATATVVPSPTTGGSVPVLYLNYTAGAPGSTFVIGGYNLSPNTSFALSINGIAVGNTTTDAAGSFALLLSTSPSAATGFYVVAAVAQPATNMLQANEANTGVLGNYRLVTSGPDAVVRVPPAGAPNTSITVPPGVPALSQPPRIALPLVLR